MTTLAIDTPSGTAKAHVSSAGEPRAALVLGHGAGGGVEAKDLVAVAGVAHSVGLSVALVPGQVPGLTLPDSPKAKAAMGSMHMDKTKSPGDSMK